MISKKHTRVIENLTQIFESTLYRRKEIIVDVDEVHRDLFYIRKGVARIFYYDDKARNHTHWISSDHQCIAIFSGILSGKRVPYGIEVIEDHSEIFRMPYHQVLELKSRSPEIQQFMEDLFAESLIIMGNRMIDQQIKSTDERYHELVAAHPDWLQRINLGYIAGYLGMTQQQLSKIRGQRS
ncbi:Crp/Fnr family transcriptional regulator [Chryseobacterium phosphatilyticum]|uniref:Crp/Fnr family transcriptional regulator n=1 Tax=Chryseobacterium phosphatilyticum TaxID=475075 RepID=A0A316WY21_9FLAO|nr:Crp/Fnr family transcriptional regulator [Chryseobacterium phosphatilyticum]PWN63550.1 Crp/Fnr family transcriptional regulator [Chryseobacterium phosphatilyticum]